MDDVTCQTCGAHFSSQEELDQHNMMTHPSETGEENGEMESGPEEPGVTETGHVTCEKCGMGFDTKDELDVHVRDAHGTM